MTNDLERVTKLAEECGARLVMQQKYDNPYDSEPSAKWLDRVSFTPEELLAFEQAVLAKRDEEFESLKELQGRMLYRLEILQGIVEGEYPECDDRYLDAMIAKELIVEVKNGCDVGGR